MSQTTPEPAATAAPPGFTLPCPCCAEEAASIAVNLVSLDDPDATFECRDCGSEFGTARVRAFLARWSAVLAWIDHAPRFED